MESLRIAMFSWESLYGLKVGGIAPHVTGLAEALAGRGHEVHVFTRDGGCGPYDIVNDVRYHRVSCSTCSGIVGQMDRMCGDMAEQLLATERLAGKFDVLHGHDWHPVTALARLKSKARRDFVFTFHSTEWGRNGNRHSGTYEHAEISHREWLAGYEAKAIIVTSPILKREVRSLYRIPSEKLHLIPNGITPGTVRRSVDAGEIKRKYGIHPFAPMALFVGRMRYQKGPDLLVEAVPHVLRRRWDVKFLFAGEGDHREACQRMAHELGIAESCRFPGYVPDDDLKDLYNACDLLVVPSRNEPFGIVVLEAWDAGKPVIGTDAVPLIDNFVNGIKARLYPESLAWCINEVIGKPKALQWMGAQGRKMIERVYNWGSVAEKTERVYRSL
ncbi:glycosyltransferase family 4 protein [Methanocella arvoryzae]|nr:glycosyltransferase family 4 protein [Methanocella arvoryzae]